MVEHRGVDHGAGKTFKKNEEDERWFGHIPNTRAGAHLPAARERSGAAGDASISTSRSGRNKTARVTVQSAPLASPTNPFGPEITASTPWEIGSFRRGRARSPRRCRFTGRGTLCTAALRYRFLFREAACTRTCQGRRRYPSHQSAARSPARRHGCARAVVRSGERSG